MKICSKCGIEKPESEFGKRKDSKDGLRCVCKLCISLQKKEYCEKNKEVIKQWHKEYNKKNKEKIKQNKREYYEENKEKIAQKNKEYHEKNKEKIKQKAKRYREEYKEEIKQRKKEYYKNNKEEINQREKEYYEKNKEKIIQCNKKWKAENRERIRNYNRDKRKNNLLFRMMCNLRSRTREAFKGKNKSKTTLELIGCTLEYLKEHLKNKFQSGMTLENYGEWHIDHIIPLSSAKTVPELCKLCHYTNLQPLWAIDNLRKGNKIIEEEKDASI